MPITMHIRMNENIDLGPKNDIFISGNITSPYHMSQENVIHWFSNLGTPSEWVYMDQF